MDIRGRVLVLTGLCASAVALAVAPAVLPAGYDWVSQTTSEAAAQSLSGAWAARLGFLLFGSAVLLLAALSPRRWGPWGTGLHVVFGVSMTAAAAFSHKPWTAGVAYDRTEDLLHSVAASGMGFAFALGVVATEVWRRRPGRPSAGRPSGPAAALSVLAVAASVVLPLAMSAWPEVSGVLQRTMFGVAYAWYAVEALRRT